MAFGWDGASSPFLATVGVAHSKLSTFTPLAPFVPFSLFAIIHATRIACAYRGGAKAGGYDERLGNFQAALVPVILVFGGTTFTSMLLNVVPGWLYSPLPIANYAIVPLVAYKIGLVSAILSLPHYPRELLFCLIDGFARTAGMTTFGVDVVLAHQNPAIRNNPWAMMCIATLGGGNGGMLLPSIRGFHADWGFSGTPAWIKDGPGVDIWGATVVGYVYATLIDAHPFFRRLPELLFKWNPALQAFVHFPKGYFTSSTPKPLLQADEAKIACSFLLAGLLAYRVLAPAVRKSLAGKPRKIKAGVSGKSSTPSSRASTPGPKDKKNQ